MKLLWLSNLAPGPVQEQLGKSKKAGLWMDHVLEDLRKRRDLELLLLCPGSQEACGRLDDRCSWQTFPRQKPEAVEKSQKDLFLRALRDFGPDCIHIWGTEFGHSLNMLEAARDLGLLDKTAVSIQGLTCHCARHYAEGIPLSVQRGYTFRDFLRQDNILQQQETFRRRGEHELAALRLARHVLGRTHWDRACTRQLAPQAAYHLCNETLRQEFYEGSWRYESCEPHRIFVSNCLYPVKGFHYALEALAMVLDRYPDAVLAVPGRDPRAKTWKEKLRQDSYARYLERLTKALHLEGKVQYLGSLNAGEMKAEYLKANAFILPSCLENSSNSLGEAMLLGLPVAAADVGGTATLLRGGEEGYVYQSTAPYMLADCITSIFDMGSKAEEMGRKARLHAADTHDPHKNLEALLAVYEALAGENGKE